jgi:hypothetical protein
VSVIKLSERETAALLALADHTRPITGVTLAAQMLANGRVASSPAGAHQAANALADTRLGLATKSHADGPVRYELTDKGRVMAARIRSAS